MDSTTLVGLTLDNYRLGHLLGRGGMGVVYKARDLATSRDVAVKVLGPGNGPGTDAAERFQRETLWLSQCDDPHIVSVYATGRADGIDYIYSTGAVLYELATGQQPFPHVHPVCLIDAILNDPPLPPSALNPCVAALDEVVLRALAKRPTARFQSVLAMTDALLRLQPKERQTRQKRYGVPAHAAVSSGAFPQPCDDSARLARASRTAFFRAATGPGVDGVAARARARWRRRSHESPS